MAKPARLAPLLAQYDWATERLLARLTGRGNGAATAAARTRGRRPSPRSRGGWLT